MKVEDVISPDSRFVQEGRPLRYLFLWGGKSYVPNAVIDVSLAFSLVEIKICTMLCRKLRGFSTWQSRSFVELFTERAFY